MKISQKGINLIKKFEGCQLRSYKCPADKWTIGYGSTGKHVKPNMVITKDEAEQLLLKDLVRFEKGVLLALDPHFPEQFEFDAMVSLAFNIGLGNFNKSTVVRKYKAGDKAASANAFDMWNKAKVNGKLTVLSGLVKRRAAEKTLFLEDSPENSLKRPQSLTRQTTAIVPESSIAPTAPKSLSKSREIIIGSGLGLGGVTQLVDAVKVSDLEEAQSTLVDARGFLETPAATNYHLPEIAGVLLALVGGFMIYKRYKDRRDGVR